MRWTRNRYCVVCSAVFFIHFLLKKRKVFFLSFSSLVFLLLFVQSVCLCIRCSGWCYLRCVYYYTIFANRRYSFQALLLNATFLLRSNRLIDCFFSTVASITFIQQWCCHFIGSWRRQFRLLVAILLRSWRLLCLTI